LNHAATVKRRNHGGIDGKLLTVPERQAISHDFKISSVTGRDIVDIHVTKEVIRPDPGARLSADTGGRNFGEGPPGTLKRR
jgi:hypothetical protein